MNGYKNIGNRSWIISLRGRVWVHASSSRVTRAEQFDFILGRVMEQAAALYSEWPMVA